MTTPPPISQLSINNRQDGDVRPAASRLAQEARQALHFGGRSARDITKQFTAASSLLPPGQLVKDEFFTLFDAVGALEITDPKMDSGLVPPGDTFDPDFDPCTPLDAKQILWIMDQLLCLEVTWHGGYPLSQTIFTSLHIDRLLAPTNKAPYTFRYGKEAPTSRVEDSLVHDVLRAYCVALIKCCQLVLFWVKAQTFFEEEDFVTHLFGRDLLPGLGSKDACKLLEEAETLLSQLPMDDDIRQALLVRLQFRRYYLVSTDFEVDHWRGQLPSLLQTIDKTHHLGQETTSAFSEKVQRLLASSTPPRPMVTVSWDEAIKQWSKIFSDISEAHNLIQAPAIHSPHCLQLATWAFMYRDPEPGTFARARMQNLLFDEQAVARTITHYDLLLMDIRDLVLAGDVLAEPESFQVEVTTDPRHICSRIMEEFLDKALDEYLNLYRMVCQNRCRMRRTFAQAIAILDALETEAKVTDDKLENASAHTIRAKTPSGQEHTFKPLTSWTKFYKLRLMAWTIQLGFETDIYLPDELGGMYSYLSAISTKRLDLLEHIQDALVERMRQLTKASLHVAVAECLESKDWLRSLTLHCTLTQTLANALWRLYTALTVSKIIPTHPRDFAAPQQLYELRFKSFLHVTNDSLPSAMEFEQASTMLQGTLGEACSAVEADVKTARTLLAKLKNVNPVQGKYVGTEEQWRKEIKQLETSCVAIAVAASQLARIVEKNGVSGKAAAARSGIDLSGQVECTIPPPGSKRYHDWWVVPQLKEKKQQQ